MMTQIYTQGGSFEWGHRSILFFERWYFLPNMNVIKGSITDENIFSHFYNVIDVFFTRLYMYFFFIVACSWWKRYILTRKEHDLGNLSFAYKFISIVITLTFAYFLIISMFYIPMKLKRTIICLKMNNILSLCSLKMRKIISY